MRRPTSSPSAPPSGRAPSRELARQQRALRPRGKPACCSRRSHWRSSADAASQAASALSLLPACPLVGAQADGGLAARLCPAAADAKWTRCRGRYARQSPRRRAIRFSMPGTEACHTGEALHPHDWVVASMPSLLAKSRNRRNCRPHTRPPPIPSTRRGRAWAAASKSRAGSMSSPAARDVRPAELSMLSGMHHARRELARATAASTARCCNGGEGGEGV